MLRLVQVRRAEDLYSGPIGSWNDLGGMVEEIVKFLDGELDLFQDIRLLIRSIRLEAGRPSAPVLSTER